MSSLSFLLAPNTEIDPFSEVLDSLKKNLKTVEIIDPILDELMKTLNLIETFLKDVNSIPEILIEILEALDEVISSLDSIITPVEEVVVSETISGNTIDMIQKRNGKISSLNKDVVQTFSPVFKDVNEKIIQSNITIIRFLTDMLCQVVLKK